jgi:hypothetical protein
MDICSKGRIQKESLDFGKIKKERLNDPPLIIF